MAEPEAIQQPWNRPLFGVNRAHCTAPRSCCRCFLHTRPRTVQLTVPVLLCMLRRVASLCSCSRRKGHSKIDSKHLSCRQRGQINNSEAPMWNVLACLAVKAGFGHIKVFACPGRTESMFQMCRCNDTVFCKVDLEIYGKISTLTLRYTLASLATVYPGCNFAAPSYNQSASGG